MSGQVGELIENAVRIDNYLGATHWHVYDADPNPKDVIGDTKPPLHLVPPIAIIATAKVMQHGAAKYEPYNWRNKKPKATTYISAAMRHLAAYFDGEDDDAESGEPHLAHVIGCMAVMLDADSLNQLIDDRPTKGRAGEIIRELSDAGEDSR